MKIYPGNDTDDSYVEIMLNCQELKTLVSALEKFENKIDQFKTNNKDIKNPGFTHLHLQDCDKGSRIMTSTVEISSMSLYILSNYEKGRISVSRPILPKEKKRLRTSIDVMSMILCGLKGNNCPVEKINEFIDNNRGVIFPDDFSHCEVIVGADYSEKQRDVLGLMQRLLYKMQSVLSKFLLGKSERQELFYLLHAFHNLPRALLSCSSKLYESSDDVLRYADEWLAKSYKSNGVN